MAKERLVSIDIMVGLAMVFVVLGHQSFEFTPDWYRLGFHEWIYRFHMEVFVFLSAFLIRYSYKGVHNINEYIKYIGRKFYKFFFPLLIIGLLVEAVMAYTRGITGSEFWNILGHALKNLLLYPMQSEASFLWYIYILFGFYLISPLVFRFPSWLKKVLCVLCLGLPLLPCGDLLGGQLFCKYMFFYFLGMICAEGYEELRGLKTWIWGLLSLPFVAWSIQYLRFCLVPDASGSFVEVGPQGYDILTGCMALPFFYFFGRVVVAWPLLTRVLSRISKDCFWIYLLQMFVVEACVIAYQRWFAGVPFGIFMAVSALLSLAFPIGCAWCSEWMGKRHTNLLSRKKK